jgi:class 3 adenylate cyclase
MLRLATAYLATLALRLTGEERQRAQLKSMFGQYVSDVVVDKIIADGQRPNLSGEKLQVTVLFSDIRNFTTISEKLDAEEVVEMLNAYFGLTCEPILEQGGMVNKFIGDAVMAVFGSPVHYDDHARRALLAAQGMAREAEFQGLDEAALSRSRAAGIWHRHWRAHGTGGHGRHRFGQATRIHGHRRYGECGVAAGRRDQGHRLRGGRQRRRDHRGGRRHTHRQTQVVHVKGKAEPIEVFEVMSD